jgi:hypothetical protein
VSYQLDIATQFSRKGEGVRLGQRSGMSPDGTGAIAYRLPVTDALFNFIVGLFNHIANLWPRRKTDESDSSRS